MKVFTASLLLLALTGCSAHVETNSSSKKDVPAPSYSTTTYVLAEPLPDRNLKISISAKEKSLYIVNCNEHIVVALIKQGSTIPVWGGASAACLSQSIIVPAGSTLSFVVPVGESASGLDLSTPYKAQIFHVLQGLDLKSADIPEDLMTSNEFKLTP